MRPDVQWRSCRESELQLADHVGRFDASRPPNVPELRSLADEPAAQRVSACGGLIAAGRSGRLVGAADWRPGRQRYHTTSAHFASMRYCRASSRCHFWPTHDAMRSPAQAKALSDVRPGSRRTVQHVSLACATVFRGMKSGSSQRGIIIRQQPPFARIQAPRHKFVLQMKMTSPACKSAAAQDSMICQALGVMERQAPRSKHLMLIQADPYEAFFDAGDA